MTIFRLLILSTVCVLGLRCRAQSPLPASYNVVWTTQSQHAGESMPCGGGDVGLNVWVEKDELLLYVARSGTFDENNQLLKAGRIRLRLSPNPFSKGAVFRQELNLAQGYVQVTGQRGKQRVELMIWVDVFRPVVHIDVTSRQPIAIEAAYENWRMQDHELPLAERAATSYKSLPGLTVTGLHDEVAFRGGQVVFFHRNRPDSSVFDFAVQQQGLDSIKSSLWNPLKDLQFGGSLQGTNMMPAGQKTGTYAGTPFVAWLLKSRKPVRSQSLVLAMHTRQGVSGAGWQSGVDSLLAQVRATQKTAFSQSQRWWQQYWQRSYIVINPDSATGRDSLPWQAGRNYQLFRYMLGCNARGQSPTKFNGGLFTYDPVFEKTALPFNPDFRLWGGGTHTAQNQRLVYWPMLKSGDVDLMTPQFDFYRRALPAAEARTRFYWHHDGACFTEQLEQFGLPQPFEYLANQYIFGTPRPEGYDKGVEYNNWLAYTWDTVLEFCLMILDAEQFTGQDISPYMPLIDRSLTFFDQHYQQEQLNRSTKPLDQNGFLVLYPGSAAETYKNTYNASSTVAGLKAVLSRLVLLPESYLTPERRKQWQAMLSRVPPIATRTMQGHQTIAPAVTWERINNVEIPQLYPVFPYGIYGLGKPDLDLAINTWRYDTEAAPFKDYVGWKQDNIFCARLGLTSEAAALTLKKLGNANRRFPCFWGPGFDWTPDHNWGGSGMIGLQEMLLQTDGKTIRLLPAWPPDWDVDFRLHAPFKTTVEGKVRRGKLTALTVTPRERMKDLILPAAYEPH